MNIDYDFMSPLPTVSQDALMERLDSLGYFAEQVNVDSLGDAILEFQQFNGLVEDSHFGPVTETLLFHTRRCGVPDKRKRQAKGGCKWPQKDVTYYERMDMPGMSRDEVAGIYDDGAQMWNKVCGIRLVRTANSKTANIVANSGRIDGRGGTLAWSFLPCGFADTDSLEQKYDTRDLLTPQTVGHEIGHALGWNHRNGTLMAAYGSSIILPTKRDIILAVDTYGKPTPKPEPEPPIVIPPDVPTTVGPVVTGVITIDGTKHILVPKFDYSGA